MCARRWRTACANVAVLREYSHRPLPSSSCLGGYPKTPPARPPFSLPFPCLSPDADQALDPLCYFAEPVDEETEPTYRTVIPDPMDFSTMRGKLYRGEYSRPAHRL